MTSGYRNDAVKKAPEAVSIGWSQCACPTRGRKLVERDFESALAAIPNGYDEGVYKGLRYGVTVRRSPDGKRISLFGRALDGSDLVSFNFYRLSSGKGSLRPCEMPEEKVVAFVRGYVPDHP